MSFYRDGLKRGFDLMFSFALLIMTLGPMALIALINRLTAGSPIFFVQNRVGRNGTLFKVIKFRTMFNRQLKDSSITVRGDRRITPLGKYLRRWKLDELPQLWNVMKGEMSFVGPRPDVSGYMDQLAEEDRKLLNLRPGITGPATLKYRSEEELLAAQADPKKYNDEVVFPDKVRINLDYFNRCSFLLDVRLLLITVGVLKSKPEDFWYS